MPASRPAPMATARRDDVDFESAFERAPPPLAIFEVRSNGAALVQANAAARAEFGLPTTDGASAQAALDGEALLALIHPDDFAAVAADLLSLRATGAETWSVTLRIARPEGGW